MEIKFGSQSKSGRQIVLSLAVHLKLDFSMSRSDMEEEDNMEIWGQGAKLA